VPEVTVKLALTPLNRTTVAPANVVPLIVTLVPTRPRVGAKLAIVGTTVKLVALVAVPPGVVTPSGPIVAPAGTVVRIDVAEATVKAALIPLNVTAVAPMKFAPPIVTLAPTGPLVGAKPAIVGAGMKLAELVAVPPGVVTLSGPVVAPNGTVARIAVSEVTEKLAAVPLNVTAVAPVKLAPPIVTFVPTGPLTGVKPAMVGGTAKALALVAVPPGVVTLSGPVVAPAGTVA
jgi:hypothetical protein